MKFCLMCNGQPLNWWLRMLMAYACLLTRHCEGLLLKPLLVLKSRWIVQQIDRRGGVGGVARAGNAPAHCTETLSFRRLLWVQYSWTCHNRVSEWVSVGVCGAGHPDLYEPLGWPCVSCAAFLTPLYSLDGDSALRSRYSESNLTSYQRKNTTCLPVHWGWCLGVKSSYY